MGPESLIAQLESKEIVADLCRLDSIDRPLFSPGQLLTDGDLTALVEWTRNKLQLARYRVGWGVVCGLGLYNDPQNEAGVVVGAGYAIDACGNDLVVGREIKVSFEKCIKAERPWEQMSSGDSGVFATAAQDVSFDGFSAPDVIGVDVALKYQENNSSPRAAMRNRGTAREYTRAKESFAIVCSVGSTGAGAAKIEAERWAEDYDRCLSVLRRYIAESSHAQGRDLHRWLNDWVAKNPPSQFRFVNDWVGQRPPDSWTERDAVRVLFWLVQDARNNFLQGACGTAGENHGVPIGRVWMRKVTNAGKTGWRAIALDASAPHKRPLQSSYWPADSGKVNLGQAIWLPPNVAAAKIGGLGIRVTGADDLPLPDEAKALEERLANSVQVAWDARVKLHIFNAGVLGYRVVGVV